MNLLRLNAFSHSDTPQRSANASTRVLRNIAQRQSEHVLARGLCSPLNLRRLPARTFSIRMCLMAFGGLVRLINLNDSSTSGFMRFNRERCKCGMRLAALQLFRGVSMYRCSRCQPAIGRRIVLETCYCCGHAVPWLTAACLCPNCGHGA